MEKYAVTWQVVLGAVVTVVLISLLLIVAIATAPRQIRGPPAHTLQFVEEPQTPEMRVVVPPPPPAIPELPFPVFAPVPAPALNPIPASNPVPIPTPASGRFVSKGERECCRIMSEHYKVPFQSVRPDFLKNPETGRNLELDCYNPDLKIAVEYNGPQHYNFPNGFMNEEQFNAQLRRDALKHKLCDLNNVYLIVVPHTVKPQDIQKYIMARLPENMAEETTPFVDPVAHRQASAIPVTVT